MKIGIVGFGFMGRMHYRIWKGIKGAQATALAVFLARTTHDKQLTRTDINDSQQVGVDVVYQGKGIRAEAMGDSWLQRSWRPITMLTFVSLIVAKWLGFTAPGVTEAVELARRPQNLPAVKELSGAESYFIDTTYAAGLNECYDKNHPLTKLDDMKWKQAISDYAREVFGSFGLQNRANVDALGQSGFANDYPFAGTASSSPGWQSCLIAIPTCTLT